MSGCLCGDPECVPTRGGLHDTTLHKQRVALITQHMPTFLCLRQQAHTDYREVESWTLPEAWDPGPADTGGDPGPYWIEDATEKPAQLLGRPVTFTGDKIVAHTKEPL